MQRQLGHAQGSSGPPATAAQRGQPPQRPTKASQQKHSRLLQRPQLKQAPWQEQESIPLLSLSSLHPDLQQLVKQRQQQPLQPEALIPHPLCELNPAALTRRIKQCSTWHDAAVLFAQQAPCLNPIHLSALLVKLAHLPGGPSKRPVNWQPFVRQVLATSQPLLQCAEPRHLSNMAWALAKLGVQDGVSECLLLPTAEDPHTASISAGFSTSSMQQNSHGTLSHPAPLHSTSSWSSSSSTASCESEEVSCSIQSWTVEWQQQVLSRLHSANCRDVSNILWALATSTRSSQAAAVGGQQQSNWHSQQQQQQQQGQQWGNKQQWGNQQQWNQPPLPQQSAGRFTHDRFVQELLSALHRTLTSSGPQDVANAMWALAVLQVRPSNELLSFLLIRLQSHFGALKPREVATTLWALSQLQAVPPSSWLQECLLRQVGRQQWQDTQPRHWAMCLTACAHLKQVPPSAWLNECLAVLQTHMPQQAAPEDVQQQVQQMEGRQALPLPPPQQQQQQVQQQQEEQPLRQLLLNALHCHHDSSSGDHGNSSCGDHGNSSCGSSSSSSSTSSHEGSSLNRTSPVTLLSTQDFTNTVWALATLRVKPNTDWMSVFVSYSAANLAAASPQELTNCMWGLQVLHVVPSEAWLAAFDAASLQHLADFTPQGLADILAAQVRLGLRPSPAWCEAWCTAVKASWGTADAPAVCKTLWAAAKCRLPLGRAWLGEALQQVHEPLLLPALAAGTLTVEELLRLVWAVGRLCQGLLSQDLSNLLGLYCCRAAGKMTGVQLGRGAWGMARLVPLPRDGLLSHFHDLAATKVKYLPDREGQVLEQKLALLRDAAAKAELLGTNWRVLLQQQAQWQQQVVAQEGEPWTQHGPIPCGEAIEQPTRSLVA